MAAPAFTNAQQNAFFTNGPQMGLSAAVRARLANEGLTVVADFDDFREDQLEQAFKNMRTNVTVRELQRSYQRR